MQLTTVIYFHMFYLQAKMNGFYDPCIGEEKLLRVRYLFRDAVHEVTIDENQPLAIPKQCKSSFDCLCEEFT